MTKKERRAEKVRMLVQSGGLFADAAQALVDTQWADCGRSLSLEAALQCVFVAEVTCALRQAGEGSK